jgi:RNA polymerase sigma factor (sigma-70 family)
VEELKSLVLRARAGDLEAYGEVVRRFQDMAYGYAYSVLGDFHLAEDAAQEAFIEAYRCLANLREPAAFPGWFRRIVFKHCDRITRRQRLPAAPLEQAGAVMSATPEPARISEARELQDRVLEAVRALPEQKRTVTTLYYIDGYSYREVSSFLDVPLGTVKRRLHGARQVLKERLAMVEKGLKSRLPKPSFPRQVLERIAAVKVQVTGQSLQGLLLTDENGHSFIMFIGRPEGLAIARSVDGVVPPRPLTHDLYVDTIRKLGGEVKELLITELKNSFFLGKLVLRVRHQRYEVDCRPSDGIAIALRAGASIHADRSMVEAIMMRRKDGKPLSTKAALRVYRKLQRGEPVAVPTMKRLADKTPEESRQLIEKDPEALKAFDKAGELLSDWHRTQKSVSLQKGLKQLDAYYKRWALQGGWPLLPPLAPEVFTEVWGQEDFQTLAEKHGHWVFRERPLTGTRKGRPTKRKRSA